MNKKQRIATAALAMALTTVSAIPAHAGGKEKCYGVVKAGHNDCGNAAKTHSCAGFSKVDGDGGEWVTVPEGLCEKLVGGSLTPIEGDAMSKEEKDG